MLTLCYGHRPHDIDMSSTSRYYPEHILNEADKHIRINQNITVKVGSEYFALDTREEIELAAKLVASYHNQYVCTASLDEGYYREAEEIEMESRT